MTDHTLRLFEQMMFRLEAYEADAISLRSLVDGLEGSFNALEERLPDAFYQEWFQYWGKLEEKLALSDEISSSGPRDRQIAIELAQELKQVLKRFSNPK